MAQDKLSNKIAAVQTVPVPQSPAVAGMIQPYSGLTAPPGWLLLDPSADTTITDAENLYPDLWANTNPAWRSGSDLVIPSSVASDGNWRDYAPTITGNNSGLTSFNLRYSRYKTSANTMVLTGFIEDIVVPDASITVITWTLPTGFIIPSVARNTVPVWAFDSPDVVVGWMDANGAVSQGAVNIRTASGNWSNTSDIRFTIEFEVENNNQSSAIIKLYNDQASVAVSDVTASETVEGNIQLSQAFEATPTKYGLVKQEWVTVSASFNGSAGVSVALQEQYGGDWVDSITYVNPGVFNINVKAGFFSAVPIAAGSCDAQATPGGALFLYRRASSSATVVNVNTVDKQTNNNVNEDFTVIVQGPK